MTIFGRVHFSKLSSLMIKFQFESENNTLHCSSVLLISSQLPHKLVGNTIGTLIGPKLVWLLPAIGRPLPSILAAPKLVFVTKYTNIKTPEVWGPPGSTSSWRPFGLLDFVLRALRALRTCDPRVSDWILDSEFNRSLGALRRRASGPRLLAGGLSCLLTLSFTPFGRSERVTHTTMIGKCFTPCMVC